MDLEQIVRNKNNMTKKTRFAVCPTCGAVSVVGGPCEYCGTQLVANEDTVTYEERIIPKRTISPMAFAQKVSVFKRVHEYVGNCAVVDMGDLCGMINLNGDFIFPLEFGRIEIYPTGIAYMQKGSDRYLFDLVLWKRINCRLPFVSSESDWHNIPVMAERRFHDDYNYYSIWTKYEKAIWEEYKKTGEIVYGYSAVFDENDRLVAEGSCVKEVETGLILSGSKYFDFHTQRTYSIPASHAKFEVQGKSLALGSSILNIKGKTPEEIQKAINSVRFGADLSAKAQDPSYQFAAFFIIGFIGLFITILVLCS